MAVAAADVLETVARICGKLASEDDDGGDQAVVVESLRELQDVHMTFEALEATKIGRAVNTLRKSAASEQARRLAAALYTGWKALADERFRSIVRTQQQQQRSKADDEGSNKRRSSSPPPLPVDAKQSAARLDGHREIASTTTTLLVEATPELETKLPRHDVFDSAAIIKKPRSLLPVINTKASGKSSEQRRVTVVRRTAAAPDPEPAPAPAPSNTRRNGGGSNNSNQQANCAATARNHGTNTAAKRVSPSPTSATPLTTAKPPPPTTTALPKRPGVVGSSGACKRKAEATTTVYDEARLERARIRLQEGYKEASAVKEKRKTKEINAIDALRKKARQQRTAHHVQRCTAIQRTGKQ
ncbi:hypothetical protein SORBI_3008G036200, partial [Sorghum bicolor]